MWTQTTTNQITWVHSQVLSLLLSLSKSFSLSWSVSSLYEEIRSGIRQLSSTFKLSIISYLSKKKCRSKPEKFPKVLHHYLLLGLYNLGMNSAASEEWMSSGILCCGPMTGQEKNVKKIANPWPQNEGEIIKE